jgi:TonB family protein
MRSLITIALFVCPFVLLAQGKKDRVLTRQLMQDDTVRVEERYTERGGQVVSRRFYAGTRPVGTWQEFDRQGKLLAVRDFSKLSYRKATEKAEEAIPADPAKMTVVSEMPQFPGGETELFKFLAREVRYPQEAIDEGVSGVVYVTGVVDAEGTWTTTEILRGAHPLLDYEAWRVCDRMPRWSPGKVDGEPVKVQYNLPIRFTLR